MGSCRGHHIAPRCKRLLLLAAIFVFILDVISVCNCDTVIGTSTENDVKCAQCPQIVFPLSSSAEDKVSSKSARIFPGQEELLLRNIEPIYIIEDVVEDNEDVNLGHDQHHNYSFPQKRFGLVDWTLGIRGINTSINFLVLFPNCALYLF